MTKGIQRNKTVGRAVHAKSKKTVYLRSVEVVYTSQICFSGFASPYCLHGQCVCADCQLGTMLGNKYLTKEMLSFTHCTDADTAL